MRNLFVEYMMIAVILGCYAPSAAAQVPREVTVPLVHEQPSLGSATLTLDYGSPFDKQKPTVLVVTDGQQFYVRPGAMKGLQDSTFGDGVNVVGIVTRGTTQAFISAALDAQGKPDWRKAWRIFNSHEWIEDIDAVRLALMGRDGKVDLYGRSGGAYLVHQYLAEHGTNVARAFTQSPVNPSLNAELGITLDSYWSDLGRQDPKLQDALVSALRLHPEERRGILLVLQRQHFYVPADKVDAERATLIRSLAAGDLTLYRKALEDYSVNSVLQMTRTNDIIPQDVRVLELLGPSGIFDKLGDSGVHPLTETQAAEIKPLLDLQRSDQIAPRAFDFAALHRSPAEVFILAGRNDEAVDYRTCIALAAQYPSHFLFMANDNHNFSLMGDNTKAIISAFYTGGVGSAALRRALQDADSHRWRED